jgi:hypothetical protein
MATKLRDAVVRELGVTFRGRPIICKLEPPGTICLKEKGKRDWYRFDIEDVFCTGIRAEFRRQLNGGA